MLDEESTLHLRICGHAVAAASEAVFLRHPPADQPPPPPPSPSPIASPLLQALAGGIDLSLDATTLLRMGRQGSTPALHSFCEAVRSEEWGVLISI